MSAQTENDNGGGSRTYRHPEWKRLYDALAPRLDSGQFYDYEALAELAGLDIRSSRGRGQFLRFAREVLDTMQLHFENVRNEGYRVVKAQEHGACAHKQVVMGRRRVKQAARIATNTRIAELTADQCKALADTQCHIASLEATMRSREARIKRAVNQLGPPPTPHRLALPKPEGTNASHQTDRS